MDFFRKLRVHTRNRSKEETSSRVSKQITANYDAGKDDTDKGEVGEPFDIEHFLDRTETILIRAAAVASTSIIIGKLLLHELFR